MPKVICSVVVGVVVSLVTIVNPGRGAASVPEGDEFCAAFDAFFAAAEPPVEGDEAVVLDTEQQATLTAWVDDFEAVLGDLVASAPEEIAADMQVVGDTYGEMLDLFGTTDFGDAASVDAFNEAATEWDEDGDDPAMATSFLAVVAYADTACGDGTGLLTPACILTADEVAAITGADVVDDMSTGGGLSVGAIDLLEPQPTTADENAAPPGSLNWTGCNYETSDGTAFTIGELIDAAGEPDPGQFERLAAIAVAPPDLADGAFVTTDGEVVVLAGDETLVFSVDGELDLDGVSLLVAVADAMVVGEYRDAEERCSFLGLRVPEEWGGPSADVRFGNGFEGDITYSSCSYELPELNDARLRLSWSEGQAWFDEHTDDTVPVAVDGLGDAAYRFKGHLFVLSGDHAVVVEAPETVDAELVAAAAEVLGDAAP